jgi:tetratricopeptide (TPR) repeat protein
LTSLVDKSMVVAEALSGVERYRLLETTRQYAEEKLLRSGEAAVLRDRHLVHFAALAAQGAPELMRQGGPAWIGRLAAEHDNLRTALAWSRRVPENGLRLAADLEWFWALEGHFSEGIGWLEELLVAAPAPTAAHVRALHGLDHLMRTWASEPTRARGYAEKALAVARELGDDALVAESLSRVGLNEAEVGEYPAARKHLEESEVLAETSGDPLSALGLLRNLGIVYIADGDWARARAALEDSGAASQAIGSPFGWAMAMSRLALLDRLEGDLVAARQRLEECIPLMVEVHHATGYWMSRAALSNLLRSEGRRDEAQAAMSEQLRSARREGNRVETLHQLVSLGILAIDESDFVRGTRLIATHSTPDGLVSTIHAPDLRVEGPAALERAREALGEAAYRVAWEQGRAMRLDQAVAYALEGTHLERTPT